MTEQKVGKIIARGSAGFVALVKQALDECVNQRIENLPKRDFTIEEHSPAEFRAEGYVIKATGDTAEGYVVDRDTLWLNSRIVKNKPGRARHICRHEIWHVVPFTAAQRTDMMALMVRADGNHPTDWDNGGYLSKPYECAVDTLAEAVSGKDSPFDDFAFYRLDVVDAALPQFLTIALRADSAPIPPDPNPEPQPPVDPQIAVLKARVATLETALTEIRDEATEALAA